MEYTQERIATFHDFGDANPAAPVEQATVVVPLAERDQGSPAANRVMKRLETVDPGRVVVALRAEESAVIDVVDWVHSFDLNGSVLWCTAPAIRSLLDEHGLNGTAGKGRDLWLALGVASESPYVAVHDADATTYTTAHVPKLLAPLAMGYDFSKGYYARIERDQLYGRLFRLFYTPIVRALTTETTADFVSYLDSFRYALAGEFAMTGEMARSIRFPCGWGLEVGTLGDTFEQAGFEGTAQVDLGIHKHEHRSVEGDGGLGEMCDEVAATLFTVLEEQGIDLSYARLQGTYRDAANRLISQYRDDARFNGLDYDELAEREQVDTYASSIRAPGRDDRLPSWETGPFDGAEILELSAAELSDCR